MSMVLPDPSVARAAPLAFSDAGCLAWASLLRGTSLKVEVGLDADFVLWNSLEEVTGAIVRCITMILRCSMSVI